MTEKKQGSKAKQPLTEDSAKQESTVRLFNKEVKRSDLFKFLGLIGFFVLCIIVVVALLPLFKDIFEPGGVDRVIERIQDAGAAGVLVLLALQFIQVVVAFIPGEVTQIAAGMLRIRHVDIGDDIHNPAVCLLRQALVLTAVSCLHMEDRDMQSLRRNGGKA